MKKRPDDCKAYKELDEMTCPRCGFRWDVNDDDPPDCLTKKQHSLKMIRELRYKHLHKMS